MADRTLEEILTDLLAGPEADFESAVAAHPEHAAGIRRAMAVMDALSHVGPVVDPAARARSSGALMAARSQLSAARVPASGRRRWPSLFGAARPVWQTALALVLAALMLGTAVAWAASRAEPGDLLYPVRERLFFGTAPPGADGSGVPGELTPTADGTSAAAGTGAQPTSGEGPASGGSPAPGATAGAPESATRTPSGLSPNPDPTPPPQGAPPGTVAGGSETEDATETADTDETGEPSETDEPRETDEPTETDEPPETDDPTETDEPPETDEPTETDEP